MFLFKKTFGVRIWTFFKVPMLFLMRPVVHSLDEKHAEISIRLGYFTKNHFKSMYAGVLVAGADLGCGLLAMEIAKKNRGKILLLFKDIQASFYKRAMGRTLFVCNDGELISQAVLKAIRSGERQNLIVAVKAFCPDISQELVAEFKMILSLKNV